ncbi:hypothetical protein EC988_002671 [Linderina pennispora]|nr:hypothetical protein EC988_002671 [Linderina pennispora]
MDDSNDNAHAEASTVVAEHAQAAAASSGEAPGEVSRLDTPHTKTTALPGVSEGNSNAADDAVVGHESQQQQQQQEQREVGHEREEHITGVEEPSSELRQRRQAEAESIADEDDIVSGTTTARTDKGKEPDVGAPAAGDAAEPGGNDEFSCNICFDSATDPVLTICGHLFCWSCLVQWLDRSATCPVCKAGCDKDKVIPVYGRGREEKDPRLNPNMPNRPAGQRPPPPQRQPNQFFGFDPFGVPGSFHGAARGGNFVFTGGFGFLPTLMGFSYTFPNGQANGMHGAASAGQPVGQQAFISRVFMMIAAMILVSILFY